MNIGHIDGNYYVSPQLSPDQMEEIANLGFVSIICNRPDFEVPDSIGSSVIGEFAKNLGIEFHILELIPQAMTAENAEKQRSLFQKAKGPVLAYCASGTRCSLIWAMGEAAQGVDIDSILQKTSQAGFGLQGLEPLLLQFSGRNG